jgi:UDP-3-O-[3-hydroxymyristoyl] glucosamine N-acyltransferase
LQITVKELAAKLEARFEGDGGFIIRGIGALDQVSSDQVIYASGRKNFLRAVEGGCGVIITRKAFKETGKALILTDDPRGGYIFCLGFFAEKPVFQAGSSAAVVDPEAEVASDAVILPGAVVDRGVVIGSGVVIYPGVYIGRDVKIGAETVIHANCVIGYNTEIGSRVLIHGGVVIGADGFGFFEDSEGRQQKIPQIGNICIKDDVEIGANCTIDRATAGSTVVGEGTKIDNLVQIAHNVKIGKNNIIVAQTGIGGSVVIGDNCVIGGQVGIADHCVIGDRVFIGSQSGIQPKVLDSGTSHFGSPSRPLSEMKRIIAATHKLPGFMEKFQD